MAKHQFIYKNPEVDLKLKFRRVFEASLVVTLLIIILFLYSFKKFEAGYVLEKTVDVKIETVEIPQTEQFNRPPPPARPSIPIASEDEDIPDELTIDETEIDFTQPINEAPPPPPKEEEPIVEFYALSDKPEVITRIEPEYPDLARKAGIEGMVVVKVLIDTKGDVEKVEIVKSHPMLDDAAMNAAKQFKVNITDSQLINLTNRWAFFDKSYSIGQIKKDFKDNQKFVDWVINTDKLDHNKMFKQNIKPFEILFFLATGLISSKVFFTTFFNDNVFSLSMICPLSNLATSSQSLIKFMRLSRRLWAF